MLDELHLFVKLHLYFEWYHAFCFAEHLVTTGHTFYLSPISALLRNNSQGEADIVIVNNLNLTK